MSVKEKFEKCFVREVVIGNNPISKELDELFNEVLSSEFDNKAEQMDEYITNLYSDNGVSNRISEPTNVEKAILKLVEKLDESDAKEVIDLLNS
ncbi:MAG: hypothetical protein RR929_00245 [Erysipelotrichaceae bacterium]